MNKNYCLIISSMRSGSTLLKALIATRPDCSDLPETAFQNLDVIESDKRIIVLKKPAGYDEFSYPKIDSIDAKKIVLIRNPYDTVCSLMNMNVIRNQANSVFNNNLYLIAYWHMVYSNVIKKQILKGNNTLLVRYEELVENPIEESARVFRFIGTDFKEGTESYSAPVNYNWTWRKDDGGDVIKTLKVRKPPIKQLNNNLLAFIESSPEIRSVLTYFGYTSAYGII